MKLLKKSIVLLEKEIPVFDLETDSIDHNFSLSNGCVVHNSKDISDSVAGVVKMIVDDGEEAANVPKNLQINQYGKMMKELVDRRNKKLNFGW